MNEERIDVVANAIGALGYEGIAAFDRMEPEYDTIETLYDEFDSKTHVRLLVLCAATQDYQLLGDAQEFWHELERIAVERDSLDSVIDVKECLATFLEVDVNRRLNDQKRKRLVKLFDAGFGDWFVSEASEADPVVIWEYLADALDAKMYRKTIVLAMKIYDISVLIATGFYLDFPSDVPIPCDLQVVRVSQTAGLTDTEDEDKVRDIWAIVMERVSEEVGAPVSLLRIDSLVWQAGQIIGHHEPSQEAARRALVEYVTDDIGLKPSLAKRLARELTSAMDS